MYIPDYILIYLKKILNVKLAHYAFLLILVETFGSSDGFDRRNLTFCLSKEISKLPTAYLLCLGNVNTQH